MMTLHEALAAPAELTKSGPIYTTQQLMDLADQILIDVAPDIK